MNASPLIVLCKINHQALLFELADEVIVPQAVADEINAGPTDDPARRFLASKPASIVSVTHLPMVISWDLGAGETAVLSYAYAERGWTAVVDDGAARRCAHVLGVALIGTLGIVLRARHAGIIPAAAPVLCTLQAHGLRLSDHVIR